MKIFLFLLFGVRATSLGLEKNRIETLSSKTQIIVLLNPLLALFILYVVWIRSLFYCLKTILFASIANHFLKDIITWCTYRYYQQFSLKKHSFRKVWVYGGWSIICDFFKKFLIFFSDDENRRQFFAYI